ncbi:hypothetical protein OIB37_32570 [Streptomyces sp. NBC_00820]|uniref:hypothetical protein n=1 Tax=Streptomyces sp. NBC_00820 TaxID=2975842 RepID=UPI002ED6B5C7|nr:hypothetical protein OIB37_32570 [Streptomyces sp. NBC_00820]
MSEGSEGGYGVDAAVAVSLIRMVAADRAAAAPWQRPSQARLVELGLDALMAGVEAPSLPWLAGLGRNEYWQAPELFDLVVEELGLLPSDSADLAAARWTAARWWAGQVVTRRLDPVRGAGLIWLEAAAELDYPDALRPLVDLATAIEPADDEPPPPSRQQVQEADIIAAARDFLSTEARPEHGV